MAGQARRLLRRALGRALAVGFVFLSAAATSGGQGRLVTARDIIDMIESGRLPEAERLLRYQMERQPSPLAGYLLGHVLVEELRFEEAEPLLRGALERRPEQATWRNELARSLLGQGRCRAAMVELDTCIAAEPAPVYRYDKAMCALNTGDLATAESELLQALAGGWESARAWYELGRLRADRGDDTEAGDALERALALDPGLLEAEFALGQLASRSGDDARAIELFRAVLDRVPGHVGAAYNLGRALLRVGRAEEGHAALLEFRRLSEIEELIENRRVYLTHYPRNLQARRDLGRLLLQAGRASEAAGALEEVLRLGGADEATLRLLARVYRLAGREAEALRAERQATMVAGETPR